jgi:hypothetical protein
MKRDCPLRGSPVFFCQIVSKKHIGNIFELYIFAIKRIKSYVKKK